MCPQKPNFALIYTRAGLRKGILKVFFALKNYNKRNEAGIVYSRRVISTRTTCNNTNNVVIRIIQAPESYLAEKVTEILPVEITDYSPGSWYWFLQYV